MVNAEDFAKAAPGASIPTFYTQKKRALGLFRELLTDGNVTFLERMCIGDIRASMPDRRRPFRKSLFRATVFACFCPFRVVLLTKCPPNLRNATGQDP